MDVITLKLLVELHHISYEKVCFKQLKRNLALYRRSKDQFHSSSTLRQVRVKVQLDTSTRAELARLAL